MTERSRNCRAHCQACGFHFTGDSAFELHRRDGQCHNPATLLWQRGKREGQPLLSSHEARCDLEAGCWRDGKRVSWVPAIVWQVYQTEDAIAANRERLALLRQDAPTTDLVGPSLGLGDESRLIGQGSLL